MASRSKWKRRSRLLSGWANSEKAADIFVEQLRKALVQVGSNGNVALVAAIGPGELIDHAPTLRERVSLELHGARLQHPICSHDQEAQSGLAPRSAPVLEVAAR